MTVIVYRDGVLAADTRFTLETPAGGSRVGECNKLYRITTGRGERRQRLLVGISGDSSPSLVWLEWMKTGKTTPPEGLRAAKEDFTALVVNERAELFLYDKWCIGDPLRNPYYAVGSGSKVALGAMHMGASAVEAVEAACQWDPYCALPISTLTFDSK